jgi:hypothetical protein
MQDKQPETRNESPVNILIQFDADEPAFIPLKFAKAFKRSIYFPTNKGQVLYEAMQVAKKTSGIGINEIVAEALDLWVKKNWHSYIKTLHNEMQSLSENDKTKATDVLQAVKKEMAHLNKSDERFKAFFSNVLESMVDYGLEEMDQAVTKAVDFERIETIAEHAPSEITDEYSEWPECEGKAKKSRRSNLKNDEGLR